MGREESGGLKAGGGWGHLREECEITGESVILGEGRQRMDKLLK